MAYTSEEKKKRLSEYLNKQWEAYYLKHGRGTSQAKWAREMKISGANLSYYMNGDRVPDGEQTFNLAKYFGAEIYDVLGEPRQISDDPRIRYIMDAFVHMSEEQQNRILKMVEEAQKNRKGPLLA